MKTKLLMAFLFLTSSFYGGKATAQNIYFRTSDGNLKSFVISTLKNISLEVPAA